MQPYSFGVTATTSQKFLVERTVSDLTGHGCAGQLHRSHHEPRRTEPPTTPPAGRPGVTAVLVSHPQQDPQQRSPRRPPGDRAPTLPTKRP